jgi:YHS domain-containing protein
LIKFIVFFVLFYFLFKFARDMFFKPGNEKKKVNNNFSFTGKKITTNVMVQDPVCKVYIPETQAITAVYSGKTYCFCSRDCMNKFASEEHAKQKQTK